MDEIGYVSAAPTVASHHEQGFEESAAWLASRLQVLNDISQAVTDLLNADHTRAWGPPGEAGDAQAIITFARQVAAFYRQILEWASAVRQANLHPLLQPVAREESRFIEPLLGPLKDLGPSVMRQCDAIAALPPGRQPPSRSTWSSTDSTGHGIPRRATRRAWRTTGVAASRPDDGRADTCLVGFRNGPVALLPAGSWPRARSHQQWRPTPAESFLYTPTARDVQ